MSYFCSEDLIVVKDQTKKMLSETDVAAFATGGRIGWMDGWMVSAYAANNFCVSVSVNVKRPGGAL